MPEEPTPNEKADSEPETGPDFTIPPDEVVEPDEPVDPETIGTVLAGPAHDETLKRSDILDASNEDDDEIDAVPGFKIIGKLGQGGMGVVYKAIQERLNRPVALKVVMPAQAGNAEFIQRFEREAQAIGKLNHPNIVTAYDFGEVNGKFYLALEYVEGDNCNDAVKKAGPFSENRALNAIREAALGLSHAHAAGIIHRDVKPANLLLASEGPKDAGSTSKWGQVKVADLGLAWVATEGEEGGSELTASGTILGTPNYMAPEQADAKDIDFRADIYGLGASLYYLVTGLVPYKATSIMAVLTKKLKEDLVHPQDANPELSDGLVRIIDRMLAKDTDARYSSYEKLISDIDSVLGGVVPPNAGIVPAEESSLKPREGEAASKPVHDPAGDTTLKAPKSIVRPESKKPKKGKLKTCLGLSVGCLLLGCGVFVGIIYYIGDWQNLNKPEWERTATRYEDSDKPAPLLVGFELGGWPTTGGGIAFVGNSTTTFKVGSIDDSTWAVATRDLLLPIKNVNEEVIGPYVEEEFDGWFLKWTMAQGEGTGDVELRTLHNEDGSAFAVGQNGKEAYYGVRQRNNKWFWKSKGLPLKKDGSATFQMERHGQFVELYGQDPTQPIFAFKVKLPWKLTGAKVQLATAPETMGIFSGLSFYFMEPPRQSEDKK